MPQVHFTLVLAKGIPDEDTISNNDLYAKITYGGQQTKSKVAADGLFAGFKYSWNQTFAFDKTNDDDIEVRLFDKDIGFDDYIGRAVFNINRQGEVDVPVITKKHEEKGYVRAKITIS